jgi:hypothetical protein
MSPLGIYYQSNGQRKKTSYEMIYVLKLNICLSIHTKHTKRIDENTPAKFQWSRDN